MDTEVISLPEYARRRQHSEQPAEGHTLQALARHPNVDIVYNANPNGTVTQDAYCHADHAGVEVLGLKDLMGRLHAA
jgi:hypothetical protein